MKTLCPFHKRSLFFPVLIIFGLSSALFANFDQKLRQLSSLSDSEARATLVKELEKETATLGGRIRLKKTITLTPPEFHKVFDALLDAHPSAVLSKFLLEAMFSAVERSTNFSSDLKLFFEVVAKSNDQVQELGHKLLLEALESDKATKERRLEMLRPILPDLFEKNLDKFGRTVFTDLPEKESTSNEPFLPPDMSASIICNQEGYLEVTEDECQLGEPLVSNKDPIGYNIVIPTHVPVKAIFVIVYGGTNIGKKEELFHPGILGKFYRYLLGKGIAIVTLNLIDARELSAHQARMPEDLHRRLHESINTFFSVLKNTPTKLHRDLESLKDKPQFLFGVSFGGRTAIRHAELYPGTFTGYISMSGAVALATAEQTDWRLTARWGGSEEDKKAREWLDPALHLNDIQDPILLIHNFDDNNVNVAVTLDFYEEAKLQKKGNLVWLYINHKGSPMPQGGLPLNRKGHHFTDNEAYLARFGEYMMSWMLGPRDSLPHELQLPAKEYELLSYRFRRFASAPERFLSEAFRQFKKSGEKTVPEQEWLHTYLPLWLAVREAEQLRNHDDLLRHTLKELLEAKKISDKVLKNTLDFLGSRLAEFLIEFYNLKMGTSEVAHEIENNSSVRAYLKDFLENYSKGYGDPYTIHVLIRALFIANPGLASLKSNPSEQDEAKALFEKNIAPIVQAK